MRRAALGIIVTVAYLVAAVSGPPVVPGRLLYDGYTPPPPYRWVRPPAGAPSSNQPPEPGAGTVALGPLGSAPATVSTGDEQAVVVFPRSAIAPRRGEASVAIRITPLDAASIGAPPSGLRYDSNAYRIDATYTASRAPAPLLGPVNIVLRYATGAHEIARYDGRSWQPLAPSRLPLTFQIYGPTNDLGTFVAAGQPQQGASLGMWAYRIVTVLLWLVAAAIAAMLVRDYTQRGRRRRKA